MSLSLVVKGKSRADVIQECCSMFRERGSTVGVNHDQFKWLISDITTVAGKNDLTNAEDKTDSGAMEAFQQKTQIQY